MVIIQVRMDQAGITGGTFIFKEMTLILMDQRLKGKKKIH